ncbi:sigma-54 dependent transcriptional regulator [Cognatishimia sp. MH4019]|uniref:sigma-54-dependent transcriptional regulator n=1 Tax=Cognatishimia sp. MH4019 TaxID=2854030 RepID=UPI001CD35F83|nr:response regulator [Cognatishimia sp. MH4019]
MSKAVLLIEDDAALRASVAQTLELEDITVTQAASYIEAVDHISAQFDGVILSDIRMPGKDGFDVLGAAQACDTDLPVILLTGEGDVPTAVRAMSEGAHDFLEKPCAPDHLVEVLNRALEHRKLVLKNRATEARLRRSDAAATHFPGDAPVIDTLREALRRAAALPVHLHINGAAGSGKRLAAYTVHALSADRDMQIGLSLRGAADDALTTLDIPTLPCTLSLKNLEAATPTQMVQLLSLMEAHPQLRVITSSTLDLMQLRDAGLSEELYFTLNLMEITVPTLAQRKGDLRVIFEGLVRQAVRSMNGDMPVIPEGLFTEVLTRDWPGNLAELRSFANSFALGLTEQPFAAETSLSEQMDAFERVILIDTLRRKDGKATQAAEALGLPRKTFYDKLARHGLRPKDYRRA